MKSIYFPIAVAACVAGAPSNLQYLDIDFNPVVEKPVSIVGRTVCSADNVLRDLRNSKFSSLASAYCSAILQKTVTITSNSRINFHCVMIETTTATCGRRGQGDSNFNIFQDDSGALANFDACSATCKTKNAAAFGFGLNTCACYRAPLSQFGIIVPTSPFIFYDIICPNVSNAIAQPSPIQTIVEKRAAPANPTCIVKASTIPSYLKATYVASRISSACSCFITNAPPACTITQSATRSITISTTNTVGETVTVTNTITSIVIEKREAEIQGDFGWHRTWPILR
ncbi:hypothetical protein VTL71DRAFT_2456 [Oculimacula yallundae]|uniref:WSC domain-containing protein n=1 Tax=Oculimacula yallundae TaxID=86028 RepID=A0ABR4C9F4_9HELO